MEAQVKGFKIVRRNTETSQGPMPVYGIIQPDQMECLWMPGDVAPRVAFEILKDVFLGDGKPGLAGDAIRCLADLMPRVEAHPADWWNRPSEDHQSDKR